MTSSYISITTKFLIYLSVLGIQKHLQFRAIAVLILCPISGHVQGREKSRIWEWWEWKSAKPWVPVRRRSTGSIGGSTDLGDCRCSHPLFLSTAIRHTVRYDLSSILWRAELFHSWIDYLWVHWVKKLIQMNCSCTRCNPNSWNKYRWGNLKQNYPWNCVV